MDRRRKTVLLVLLSLLAAAAGTWAVLRDSAPDSGGPGASGLPARGRAARTAKAGPLPRAEPRDGDVDAGKGAAPVRVPARVRVIAVSRDGGAPLPGATVRLADGAGAWTGIADDDGAVLFEDVEMGGVTVSADAPGAVGLQRTVVLGPGGNPDETLALAAAGNLVLGFASSLDGSPVVGARVSCGEAESVTGADGIARLAGGEAGTWSEFEVKAEGCLWATGRVLHTKDAAVDTRAEFHLHPEGRIRGRVLDPTGTPVPGLQVGALVAVPGGARGVREWAENSGWGGDTASMLEIEDPPSVAAGPDGGFTLRGLLAGGLYRVRAVAERAVIIPDPVIAAPAGESPFLDLVFDPGAGVAAEVEPPGWSSMPPETAFLRGTVVDGDGRPQAGIVLEVGYLGPVATGDPAEEGLLAYETWPLYEDGVTDGEGRFSLEGIPAGRWRLVPLPRDSVGFATPAFVEAPAEGLRLVAEERLPGVLAGRIVADPKHSRWKGLDFVMATVRRITDPDTEGGGFQSVRNPKEGFRIADVPAGEVIVSLRIPGYLPWRVPVDMPAAGIVDLGEIHLEPAPQIDGQVVDGEGRPVPGALVRRADRWNPSEAETTDAAGRFALGDLDAGENRVLAEAAGFAPLLARVDAGVPGEKTLVLRRGSVLRVLVLDARGRPLPLLPVRIRSGGDGGYTSWCITDPRGRVLGRLPEGTWEVAVFLSARRPGDPPDVKQGVVLHDGRDADERVVVAR